MWIFSLLVIVPVGLVSGNCMQEMSSKSGFAECMTSFQSFTLKMSSATPEELMDQSYMAKTICSNEGRGAFGCIMPYLMECPEMQAMFSNAGAGDPAAGAGGGEAPVGGMEAIMQLMGEDGIDVYCAMETGECAAFKTCFPQGNPNAGSMRKKRQSSSGEKNIYQTFQQQAASFCMDGSEMKTTMLCLDAALQKCDKAVIPKIENLVDKTLQAFGLNSNQMGLYGLSSYTKSVDFVKKSCPKMPSDFATTKCYAENMTKVEECYGNVANMFPKLDQCTVKTKSDHCVSEFIEPGCGEQFATFFTSNNEYMYPKMPAQCFTAPPTDSASAIMGTFGMMLFSILATVFV